jgi:hypothetical protein
MKRLLTIVVVLLAAGTAAGCSSWGGLGASERPGLGTTWGETRGSRVDWVSFERDDPQRPFAVATVYYDDPAGIRAQVRQAAFSDALDDGPPPGIGAVRVRLLDAWGNPLPTFTRGARQYVEGRGGERYTIEIANRSAGRVEAVATVDGLDVFDGRCGGFAKRGYVLEPWSTFRIDGFRKNMAEVAAFRFGAVGESYAAQTGDDANVGVIGVAFFSKRGALPQWPDAETERRRAADPFPGRFAQPPP